MRDTGTFLRMLYWVIICTSSSEILHKEMATVLLQSGHRVNDLLVMVLIPTFIDRFVVLNSVLF